MRDAAKMTSLLKFRVLTSCFNGACELSQPISFCTTIPRYPIFNTRYSVMCKVYTEYHGTSEIEHGLCACTVDNPLAKARGLSLHTGAQTMLCLSHNAQPSQTRSLVHFSVRKWERSPAVVMDWNTFFTNEISSYLCSYPLRRQSRLQQTTLLNLSSLFEEKIRVNVSCESSA